MARRMPISRDFCTTETTSTLAIPKATDRPTKKRPAPSAPAPAPAPAPVVRDMGAWTPRPELDASCLRAAGFREFAAGDASACVLELDDGPGATYATGCYRFAWDGGACPICGGTAHGDEYLVLYTDTKRRVLNPSPACLRGGKLVAWSAEGWAAWGPALQGTPHARLGEPSAGRPTSLPREVSLFAPALAAMQPPGKSWVVGRAFLPRPAGDPSLLGFIGIKEDAEWDGGDGGAPDHLATVSASGWVTMSSEKGRRVTPLTPAAQRLLDSALRVWFQDNFPDHPPDAGGVFTVPTCSLPPPQLLDDFKRARLLRKHASCCTRTVRPWSFLHELAAHAALRADAL